jgi:hypothetical protein
MLRSFDGRPVTTIRHTADSPPQPLGCRWCGFGEREHAQRWIPSRGFHSWEQPTRAQVEARMRVKFAAKRGGQGS